jgi:histidinol dehydrogenase
LSDVQTRGDQAIIDYTAKFDRQDLTPGTLAISAAEIDAAVAATPADQRTALETAAARITAYHTRQLPEDADWTDESGVRLAFMPPVASPAIRLLF